MLKNIKSTFSLIMSYNIVTIRVRRIPLPSNLNSSDRTCSPPCDRKWRCAYGKLRKREATANSTYTKTVTDTQHHSWNIFISPFSDSKTFECTFFLTLSGSAVANVVNSVCRAPLSIAFTWTTGLLQDTNTSMRKTTVVLLYRVQIL